MKIYFSLPVAIELFRFSFWLFGEAIGGPVFHSLLLCFSKTNFHKTLQILLSGGRKQINKAALNNNEANWEIKWLMIQSLIHASWNPGAYTPVEVNSKVYIHSNWESQLLLRKTLWWSYLDFTTMQPQAASKFKLH